MRCKICKIEFEENLIQEHHLHPKFMDNKDGKGMKIPLCEKCHNILHLQISAVIFRNINDKQKCIEDVMKYSHTLKGRVS